MSKNFVPLRRCMSCVSADADIAFNSGLDLCVPCLRRRLTAIEPGTRLVIVLEAEGYDYDELEGATNG